MDMEASEMLDIVHYFLDEDMRYTSVDEFNFHSSIRNSIFGDLYGTPYKYGANPSKTAVKMSDDGLEIKPYIPPTEVDFESNDPFAGVLDSPLG